jgi:hypothetical protein
MSTEMKPIDPNPTLQANDEEQGLTGKGVEPLAGFGKEPDSHLRGRTFLERCGLFSCIETKNKLDHDEILSFWGLKKEMLVDFDATSDLHLSRLADLHKACFIDEHTILQDEIDILQDDDPKEDAEKQVALPTQDKRWLTAGFQRTDPSTDFRGGGLVSLKCLIYFVSNYRQKWDEMIEYVKISDGMFIPACVSIGCTFYLKQFFHLMENINYKRDKQRMANRTGLKNFCRVIFGLQ